METEPVDTSYDECAPPPPPPQIGNAQATRVANGDCAEAEPMRVRVQYATSGTDVGDSVRVDVSVNGGSYTQIAARPAPLPPGPLSVPDLALWLRADDGLYQDAAKTTPATAEGHPVGAWEDRSGHGRDVTQATAAARPTLRLGVAGGEPAVRFDGVDDELRGSDSITPRTVFAVVKMNAENVCVLGRSGSHFYGWFTQRGNPSRLQIRDGSATPEDDLSTAYAVGQWDIFAGTMAGSGARSALHVSGERRDSSALQVPSGGRLILGARQDPDNRLFLDGDIAELVVYDRVLTAEEIRTLELYLA